jgi:hemoglobin-like flavoprotein
MNETTKQHVQRTWKQVEPIAEVAAGLFYEELFRLDPTVQKLFRGDMKAQGKRLMQMIGAAVAGLDDLAALVPAVEELGRRHVGYGVRDAHYDTVGQALLTTLEKGLGPAFTPEVKSAWTETYVTLATVMKSAAANAPRAKTRRARAA